MRVQRKVETFEAEVISDKTESLPPRQRINNKGKYLVTSDDGRQEVVDANTFKARFEKAT